VKVAFRNVISGIPQPSSTPPIESAVRFVTRSKRDDFDMVHLGLDAVLHSEWVSVQWPSSFPVSHSAEEQPFLSRSFLLGFEVSV
jgi:hypothetical protein